MRRSAIPVLVLVVTLLGPPLAAAQEATPAAAPFGTPVGPQLATPVPGAQTWHVLVHNVSPDGKNWSFNAFYPDNLQAHPGDTIVFTLAPNSQAFHTVQILTAWRL